MELLAKFRALNKLFLEGAGQAINFSEMSKVLKDVLNSDIYVVSRKGKILGLAAHYPFESEQSRNIFEIERKLPENYNQLLLNIHQTVFDHDLTQEAAIPTELRQIFEIPYLTIVPVIAGDNRLGTLVIARKERGFIEEDLILAECGATVVGIEVIRVKEDEMEDEARNKAIVQVSIATLSFSELEAVEQIFHELGGQEGLLVASKIADRLGITRSVIVNALRKLESAGLIETRSLGMKGTYIKILNPLLLQELERSKV